MFLHRCRNNPRNALKPEGAVTEQLVGLWRHDEEAWEDNYRRPYFGVLPCCCTTQFETITHLFVCSIEASRHRAAVPPCVVSQLDARVLVRVGCLGVGFTRYTHNTSKTMISRPHMANGVRPTLKVMEPNSTRSRGRSNCPVGIATLCGHAMEYCHIHKQDTNQRTKSHQEQPGDILHEFTPHANSHHIEDHAHQNGQSHVWPAELCNHRVVHRLHCAVND